MTSICIFLQECGVFNWRMPDCEELIEILLGGLSDFWRRLRRHLGMLLTTLCINGWYKHTPPALYGEPATPSLCYFRQLLHLNQA